MSAGLSALVPLILRRLIELPAAISLAFFPSATLSAPQLPAKAIIR